MKKRSFIPLSVLALMMMVGCSISGNSSTSNTSTTSDSSTSESSTSTSTSENYGSDYDYNSSISVEEPEDIEVDETSDEFEIETSDGTFTKNGSVYTITAAGTYTLTGKLTGQVLIEAGDDDEVVLELNGVSITYGSDSPIKAVSGGKLEISAKKDTDNVITDSRSKKTTEVASQGEGAISADIDLKLKGTGTLVVTGNYNNGVHTSKDLTIQKLTLKATGYNNGIKGKDSVTINSGTVQAYALTGNGIKTDDSDVSSKNKQRGTIAINGGTVYVDSLHDGIDASYNIEIDEVDSEVPTNISVKTGLYSVNYNKSTFKADSEKGLKAANNIVVNNGTVVISASDDAVHANYGDSLENGSKGQGNITVNAGQIKVASGDDGLHADNTLTVNGGKVVVTGATEGYEANYININGGYSYIYGTDDGVNVSKKSFNSCAFTMSGGYLDVAVKSGDTDGIDSNGNFTLSGGVIVTRGSPGSQSGMSTGLDVDGTVSMTGGTLIAFNGLEKSPTASSTIHYAGTSGASSTGGMGGMGGPGGGRPGQQTGGSSSASLAAGNYTLSGSGLEVSFTNDYTYSSFLVYSANLATGSTYTLTRGTTTVYSWTQSSSSVTIS